MHIKVGEIIKIKRKEKKIPLAELAREAGISAAYLSQLENGRKENPNLEIMLRIVKALNIELETLLGLEQEPESPALRIPSLLRLVIAKDRNMKALEDKETQRKVSALLDKVLESKYLIEDDGLYNLFLDDLGVQADNTLKRYMAMGILLNSERPSHSSE